ncbi:MAG: hypothetical protein AB1941_19820, partial [Gemmatimonadota bacterium]
RRRGAWVPDHVVRRHICPDALAEAAWAAFAASPRTDDEVAQVIAAHLSLARRLAPAGWTAAALGWDGPEVTYSDGVTECAISGPDLLAAARRLFGVAARILPLAAAASAPACFAQSPAATPASGPRRPAGRAGDLQIALFA